MLMTLGEIIVGFMGISVLIVGVICIVNMIKECL